MKNELSKSVVVKALDWTYDKAINGVPGFDSAADLADNYLKKKGSTENKADSLIKWQIAKASTSGFLTGLGGLLIMPVSIPANISSVMYVQLRMVAAIAHMGGHDVRDDRVRTLAYACLAGNSAKDVVKNVGIVIGTKMTNQAIKNISGKTITAINQKVGFKLLTKFGQKGAINLGKAIPLIGGFIGGSIDGITTKIIGNIAKGVFLCPHS